MSGRRRHERFQPARPWDGRVRVLRDVVVQLERDGGLVTFGSAPGVVGEVLKLDVAGGGQSVALDVEVTESKPVIVEGDVMHRVQLAVVDASRLS